MNTSKHYNIHTVYNALKKEKTNYIFSFFSPIKVDKDKAPFSVLSIPQNGDLHRKEDPDILFIEKPSFLQQKKTHYLSSANCLPR